MSDAIPLSVDVHLPLDPFTLSFEHTLKSRVTGLFGPSGSGKTSLVETIAGLRPDATGKIEFGGSTWLDSAQGIRLPPERRGIGFVPQRGLLFPHLTVRQNIQFGSNRAPAADRLPRFDQVVRTLNLEHLLDRKPVALSGGERQRVAAGRAVCSGPQLLIMDEPLSSLDVAMRYQTLAFLVRLVNDLNVNMIWVSHDAVEVQAVCDELITIDQGQIQGFGKPSQVLTAPATFSAFEHAGFQNVLHGKVTRSNKSETAVCLAAGDPPLELTVTGRNQNLSPGDDTMLTIPARSILLATKNPSHVSAGNILQGSINRIDEHSSALVVVHVSLMPNTNSTPLVVELTTAARDRLQLKNDQPIYVLIKSTACVLHPMGAWASGD